MRHVTNTAIGAELHSVVPKRLLLMASSPSDLVEMLDMAQMLAQRGNSVILVYLCEGESAFADAESRVKRQAANGLDNDHLEIVILDMNSSSRGTSGFSGGHLEDPKGFDAKQWGNATRKSCGRWLGYVGLRSFGIRLFLLVSAIFQRAESLSRRFWRRLRACRRDFLIHFPTIHSLVATPFILDYYDKHLGIFRSEFRRLACDAVLIPEDVVGAVWPVAIKAAREIGIPSLVFPYTLANQKEAVHSLMSEPAFQSANNRLAAWLFPKWRWRKNGLDLVRLPSGHIAAHDWLGVSPPDPWLMNSGFSDAICVDSQASRDYFIQAGIPCDKIVVTGSVSQDHLYDQLRSKSEGLEMLRRELGLEGIKPLLLISGCPNQLAGKVPFCQFSSIEEIADHLGQTVASLSESYHLVVRPHPNFLSFGDLLRPWGITPTTIPTSRLVPLSDLFIAFASATIRWAVACAVPTINYDVFHYGYGDFSSAKGVRTVTDAEDFAAAVGEMEPGCVAYHEAKTLIESSAAYWSMMDGHCAERIEAAVDAECRKGWAQRTSR